MCQATIDIIIDININLHDLRSALPPNFTKPHDEYTTFLLSIGTHSCCMEMDSLQTPLISNRDPDDQDDELQDAVEPAVVNEAIGASSPGLFMWLLTFSAGISGLLFGCTASPSPTHFPVFKTVHHLTTSKERTS